MNEVAFEKLSILDVELFHGFHLGAVFLFSFLNSPSFAMKSKLYHHNHSTGKLKTKTARNYIRGLETKKRLKKFSTNEFQRTFLKDKSLVNGDTNPSSIMISLLRPNLELLSDLQ